MPPALPVAVPVSHVWRRLYAALILIAACGALAGLAGCGARQPLDPGAQARAGADVARNGPPAEPVDLPPQADRARPTSLGGPIEGLGPDDLARFNEGLAEFQEEDGIEEGLGPVFNEASCGVCHSGPVGGTNGRAETRFGMWAQGAFNPLSNYGGSLVQDHAIGRVGKGRDHYFYRPEVVPSSANVQALRITTPLFGLGLVDAVSDAALIELARREARDTPMTCGTPHMVSDPGTGALRVGRFGWKAQVASLHTFSGDAYLNEMGVTNPDFPNENAPQGDQASLAWNPMPGMNDDGTAVGRVFDFMRLLGPPPRGPVANVSQDGGEVFRQIGCADCHTPTLVTGESAVPALAHKSFQPFSDFLLHDMGSLGDGIAQGQSSGRQMRTAPLWGLASRPTYLHDGRAKTVQDAIAAHAGQGRESRERYLRLGFHDRLALLAFLKTL